jgi:hypothetical protein
MVDGNESNVMTDKDLFYIRRVRVDYGRSSCPRNSPSSTPQRSNADNAGRKSVKARSACGEDPVHQRWRESMYGGAPKNFATRSMVEPWGTLCTWDTESEHECKRSSAMKTLNRSSLVLITAFAAMAEWAYGTQPPDVVTSDLNFNTAMGTDALLNLSSVGSRNTASGWSALISNTAGYQNTASGFQALYSNTTGTDNVASGVDALYANTSGSNNTASGSSALPNNTTGDNNTASGSEALFYNTTGSYNTASGGGALLHNGIGSYNTASGSQALDFNTTGNNNTASGFNALFSNTTGSRNRPRQLTSGSSRSEASPTQEARVARSSSRPARR